jgi:zinc D-Ala-D-Ala dipeptidase
MAYFCVCQKPKLMNMKAHFSIAFILLMLNIFYACTPQVSNQHNYEEKLGVIANPRMYQKIVEVHPEKEFVDLELIIPGIALDIRYATKNNFTGKKVYASPRAFVRKPVAEALAKVQAELQTKCLALKVFDAYRPYSATVKFYEIYPDTNFVAAPWHGSRHNRGCAVDVTLIDIKTGKELEMPTPFDDFSKKAGHSYMDLSQEAINNRALLKDVMMNHGFTIYNYEWWHYDFVGWENFELMNIPFDQL